MMGHHKLGWLTWNLAPMLFFDNDNHFSIVRLDTNFVFFIMLLIAQNLHHCLLDISNLLWEGYALIADFFSLRKCCILHFHFVSLPGSWSSQASFFQALLEYEKNKLKNGELPFSDGPLTESMRTENQVTFNS